MRVAVLGAGSWGTAFSLVLADAGNDVVVWARRREVSDAIDQRHENPDYLPGVMLPSAVTATADAERAIPDSDLVVFAVPSQLLREHLERWRALIPRRAGLLSLVKGVEVGTDLRMSQVITQVTGCDPQRVAVLTGPNLSHEIADRQPAASVVAALDEPYARVIQDCCHSPTFRPYTNGDVVGCELAGATKNVIALAVGMAIGLGFGDNATATVITRGLAETARLGVALGADPMTFSGLAGLGDLVATCSSRLSRNRSFSKELGRGRSVDEIAAGTRQVAEGVRSCLSIRDLARATGVEMPIVEQVADVVLGETTPKETLGRLLSRATKAERD